MVQFAILNSSVLIDKYGLLSDLIIFRCSADPVIGFGHLIRCRALAKALYELGESCIMIGPSEKYKTIEDNKIFLNWFVYPSLESVVKDVQELLQLAEKLNPKMIVLDDYRVNEYYQLELRKAGIRWLQFDNGRNPIWADIILNTNPVVSKDDYNLTLKNPEAILLLGEKYSIIRSEFPPNITPSTGGQIKKVLLTFGGGDDCGAIIFTLETLLRNNLDEVDFLIVSGEHNPRNDEISQWIKSYGNGRVKFKINPASIVESFSSCDIAIMAGGRTIYEVSSCGLPMILIAIADNQVSHSKAWSQKTSMVTFLGKLNEIDSEKLLSEYNKVKRKNLLQYHNKKPLVDGLGRIRVAKEIINS